jgi:hypothetical protein
MSEIWKWSNLGLAFAMELVALAALAAWGWKTGTAITVKLALGIGVPVAAAIVWGMFAAPNAQHGSPVLAVATKIVVFGGATLALWAIHYRMAAVAFIAVVVTNLLAIKLGHLQ